MYNPRLVPLVLAALLGLAACHDDDESVPAEPAPEPITESGRFTLRSSGLEREYYVSLPAGYVPGGGNWPLLIALHGAGDSIEGWLPGGFQGDGLLRATADSAIMVIPNAREVPEDNNRRKWDTGTETDYTFFLDLLAQLDQRIN
ncbi:MAG: hypothetical protein ACR2P6_01220, partial [Gammaproteobacteria bacterium]